MQTTYPLLFVVSLGVAVLMVTGAGYPAAVGQPGAADDLRSGEELGNQANNSSVGGPSFEGAADSADEGDVLAFVINGAKSIAQTFGFILLLPFELRRMGFPWWFAGPIGLAAQLIAGIGVAQFAANRRLT